MQPAGDALGKVAALERWGASPVAPWVLWAIAASLVGLTTRNPAYLLLLLLAVGVVRSSQPLRRSARSGWGLFLRAGLFLWLVTIPLNTLTVHYGDTVLATIPPDLPWIGGIVGGAITLEAAAYGFLSGLGLLAVLAVLVTMNEAVEPHELLRSVPPALFQTGIMVTIGLSFFPHVLQSVGEIREAQSIRGHRWRGLRDWVPLLLPLLTTALEQAVQLAASLEARGFGTAPVRSARMRRWSRWLLLAGLGLVLAGLLLGSGDRSTLRAGGIFGGIALLAAALHLQNRNVARTRYRRIVWRPADCAAVLGAACFVGAYLWYYLQGGGGLAYDPYPTLHWPGFDPPLGAAFLALTGPSWGHLGKTR